MIDYTEAEETVFESTFQTMIQNIRNRGGGVTVDDIITIMRTMQQYKMDGHCVIAGQNGVGKSHLLMIILKEYFRKFHNLNWVDFCLPNGEQTTVPNMILARHTTNDLVRFILENEQTICGIDEFNRFMSYKQHMYEEQNNLMTNFELGRSKSIAFFGCIRDPRKISLNYRNGKMSVVIWIIDRYKAGGSYAAIFVANPSVENDDRFGFDTMGQDLTHFNMVRQVFENLPSFVGYMYIQHSSEFISEEELSKYEIEKNKAMAIAHIQSVIKRYIKKEISMTELLWEKARVLETGQIQEDDIKRFMPNVAQKRITEN